MSVMTEQTIEDAIASNERLTFEYNGEVRVVTPETIITGPSGKILVGVETAKGYRRYTLAQIKMNPVV